MENEKEQKELFEFKRPKKAFPMLRGILPKADFDGRPFAIMLSIDKLIFICIGIIMLMVIMFALGVERGKSVTPKVSLPVAQQAIAQQKTQPVKAQPVAVTTTVPKIVPVAANPYSIVIMALTKNQTAQAEIEKAKKSGFNAFISYSTPYYLVCIGAFPNKESVTAKQELIRVKRVYKDAYLKLR